MFIVFTILTFFFTLLVDLAWLKYKDKLLLILGFTASVLLVVVAFDILPEIITLTRTLDIPPINPMIALIIGFLIFHIFEKLILIHYSQDVMFVNL